MSKTSVFVVTCSAVILAFFGVFCFLMTTVNPPPLIDAKPDDTTPNGLSENKHINFYLRSMDPSAEVKYGLEKVDIMSLEHTMAPFYFKNPGSFHPIAKSKYSDMKQVYPPTKIATQNTTATATTVNPKKVFKNTTTERSVTYSAIKGRRRSVNNIETKTIDGSVILRILDDSGQSRIEIKLSPNEIYEKKKLRMHRSSVKKYSRNNVISEKDDMIGDVSETEIRILPNDTVIIDNVPQEFMNTTEVYNGFSLSVTETVSLTDAITAQTTQKEEETLNSIHKQNLTPTGMFTLKILFDNVTKSFTEPYAVYVDNKTSKNT